MTGRSCAWLSVVILGSLCLAGVDGEAVSLAQQDGSTAQNIREPKDPTAAEESSKPPGGRRLREGTRVQDRMGYFKLTGKRWSFIPVGTSERFTVLENLALERIARILDERPDSPTWRVAGKVTEFEGLNYLLIEHVVFISTPESSGSKQWSGEEAQQESAPSTPDSPPQG